MSGETDGSKRGKAGRPAKAGCLAVALGIAAGQAAAAVAIPGQVAGLAESLDSGAQLAAQTKLTLQVRDIEVEPGIEVPISVTLPSAAELREAGADKGSFLLIRNIPEGVTVSAGMTAGRVWVVPLREVSSLRIVAKPEASARFQLRFLLIGPNSRVLAETPVTVNLRPVQPVAAVAPSAPMPEALKSPQVQTRPQTEPLSAQEEAVLLARGRDIMQQGGIAAARIIFEELAANGSAAGALALARTYDPAFAGPPSAATPAPNMAEARKWYERAAALGNLDARRRLAEIASGG